MLIHSISLVNLCLLSFFLNSFPSQVTPQLQTTNHMYKRCLSTSPSVALLFYMHLYFQLASHINEQNEPGNFKGLDHSSGSCCSISIPINTHVPVHKHSTSIHIRYRLCAGQPVTFTTPQTPQVRRWQIKVASPTRQITFQRLCCKYHLNPACASCSLHLDIASSTCLA